MQGTLVSSARIKRGDMVVFHGPSYVSSYGIYESVSSGSTIMGSHSWSLRDVGVVISTTTKLRNGNKIVWLKILLGDGITGYILSQWARKV